jgi:hypothetical protein
MVKRLKGLKVDHEGASIYTWIPRKQPHVFPAESGLEGWELHFVEAEYYKTWSKILAMALAVAFTYGISGVIIVMADSAVGLTVTDTDLVGIQVGYLAWAAFKLSQ